MAKTLSNPTVEVDDDVISIIPNSLSYKEGSGDTQVKAESGGGNSIVTIVTENAETKISMCKFKLSNTEEHLNQIKEWKASNDDGGVTISLSEGAIQVAFREMILTVEPERTVGADGELEVDFQGPPVE